MTVIQRIKIIQTLVPQEKQQWKKNRWRSNRKDLTNQKLNQAKIAKESRKTKTTSSRVDFKEHGRALSEKSNIPFNTSVIQATSDVLGQPTPNATMWTNTWQMMNGTLKDFVTRLPRSKERSNNKNSKIIPKMTNFSMTTPTDA